MPTSHQWQSKIEAFLEAFEAYLGYQVTVLKAYQVSDRVESKFLFEAESKVFGPS